MARAHGRAVEVDGAASSGLSWVPITPFGIKDWERWEDGEDEPPARLDGWVSRDGQDASRSLRSRTPRPTIAEALGELPSSSSAPRRYHATCSTRRRVTRRCDAIGCAAHVGSRAIRQLVERQQPPLVLSGHIHESPRVSAAYRDRIGDSVVVNPGQFGTSRLCGVWFDPVRIDEYASATPCTVEAGARYALCAPAAPVAATRASRSRRS